MNVDLSPEATEYGKAALRAFEEAGGDEIVQRAETGAGAARAALVEPVLAGLGALDLDVRSDPAELEAAAALCRSAGWWAVPYPLAERLARPRDVPADGLLVVPGGTQPARAAVAGLDLHWVAVTLDGQRFRASPRPPEEGPRKGAYVCELTLSPLDGDPNDGNLNDGNWAAEAALGLVLPCWTLLGMLDRAIEVTRAHVLARQQFGQPLSAFQGVQFQLTDAAVERIGLEELAKYALWSVVEGLPEAIEDALALRLAAIEAADTIFRVTHQLHGAMGFCDETTLSWLSRYSAPLRRLPFGLSATRDVLTHRIGRRGLTGLFSAATAGVGSGVGSA